MGADRRRIGGQQQREIVTGMQTAIGRQVTACAFELFREFAKKSDYRRLPPAAGSRPAAACSLRDWVVQMPLHVGGGRPVRRTTLQSRNGRIIRLLFIVQEGVGDIQPEAVHAAIQPQVQHLQRRFARALCSSSSAWAAGAGTCGDNIAAAPADRTRQDRRTPTASCWAPCHRFTIGPYMPVHLFRITVAAGGESSMFITGMRQHLVQDNLQAARMGGIHKPGEVLQRAIVGMDVFIVRNVIGPVAVRRRMDRRQSDRIHAQRLDIIQLSGQADKVALPVAITVAKAADINLIDRRATPPR